mmetsp:Transcript_45060/g.101423  ORF Transcript_45060/g.101423 Transcript_45060/m.101423 type:complete len:303 (-) Transcript_45060:115-1023(-)|eukprot:CAMPEP_0197921298 /NCGR_PEP_ID=MMETSP1439-20131203/90397_1 /TAXON_ID=66791 /ORGANISM="Gonyaulax spinifera, Strain CCMP409" /LENGTH=302 /DNA_ID=CAMNT_0043543545 /DNA_START=69 /DNA_END=977 /DNA_ORIENTATION=+
MELGYFASRRPRLGRSTPLLLTTVLAIALLWPLQLCWRASAGQASWAFAFSSRGPTASRRRQGLPALGKGIEGDSQEDAVWKSAYELELDRNRLIRDQLQSSGISGEEDEGDPEACAIDWETNYNSLKECNAALEARLRGGKEPLRGNRAQDKLSEEELDARLPVRLPVQLEHRETFIEVFRRHGPGSTFHNVEASLPLGLNITLRERGDLRGSFVVEDVLPGGFGESSGLIKPGDAVLGLTTRVTSMGVTTFDSGVPQALQHLVDTSFISSAQELVEAISTNTNGNLILVLERQAEPQPTE